MATAKSVWGIDIGQAALKALKLRSVEGQLQVEAFDVIEHPKILSQPDADRPQLIRNALEQFLARNSVVGSSVVISVPGQSSFTRFVKLPPVEPKKIPDIVRFEAEQQIPFPISEVVWRWQTYEDPDSPDVEVGIFAMKRIDIQESLRHFRDVELEVDAVQMAPLALYNFMTYDGQVAEEGATLLVDVGADKTDLVVADGPRMWTRTIQIGGNNFTESLVKSFKLSFPKAEKLKRTAASSKYARQIFQAMRPVFSDLVQEIQRSIGFYTSLHRETRFKRLLGLGNGFRLPGLQKFLEQNLNIPVVLADSYNKLSPSANVNAPLFTDNVRSFAVAYGLAVQGLGEAPVSTNLLPNEIVTARVWARKRPWFIAAAVVLVASLTLPLYRAYADESALEATSDRFDRASRIVREYETIKGEYRGLMNQTDQQKVLSEQYVQMLGYRNYQPWVQAVLSKAIESVATDQALILKYAQAATPEQRQAALAAIRETPRDQRKMIFLESMRMEYVPDLAAAALTRTPAPAAGAGGEQVVRRGFRVTITGRSTLSQSRIDATLAELMREASALAPKGVFQVPDFMVVQYGYVGADNTSAAPRAGVPAWMEDPGAGEVPGTPKIARPDPILNDEDMSQDTRFVIALLLTIEGDGITVPPAEATPN